MPSPRRWSFAIYSRGQQIMLAVLTGICVLMAILLKFYHPEPPYYAGSPELQTAMARLNSTATDEIAPANQPVTTSFNFDPNTVNESELQQLGLSEKQAKSWIKYRAGQPNRFKQPGDISKLYVLKPADVARLLPLIKMNPTAGETARPEATKAANKKPERFEFDPNTVNTTDLQRLGLSSKQANSFIKYRDRRNKPFQSADELDNIRVLRDDQKIHLKALAVIEPPAFVNQETKTSQSQNSVHQPKEANNSEPATYTSTVAPPVAYNPEPEFTLDINQATALDLEQMPGIGPFWAKRILETREKLGGFISNQQVSTAYGLPDSTFQGILSYLETPGPIYRKVAINLLTKEELKEHPYINYKLAGIIVKFREQHGAFKSIEGVRRIRLFNKTTEQKLAPYLDYRLE